MIFCISIFLVKIELYIVYSFENLIGLKYMEYIKVVLVGDSGCGKSSIINKYVSNSFHPKFGSTVGSEFKALHFTTPKGKDIGIHIWDTAGQERFRSFVRLYFKNAFAILFVFDLTSMNSLQNVEIWYDEYKKSSYGNEKRPLFLVGNKSDMYNQAVNNHDLISAYIEKYGFIYIETSAKSGSNIDELFAKIKDQIIMFYDKETTNKKNEDVIAIDKSEDKTILCQSMYCNIV